MPNVSLDGIDEYPLSLDKIWDMIFNEVEHKVIDKRLIFTYLPNEVWGWVYKLNKQLHGLVVHRFL